MRMFLLILFCSSVVLLHSFPAYAAEDFSTWLKDFKHEAKKDGVSDATLEKAFAHTKPIDRVIELDHKQPEGTMTFVQYRKRIVSNARVQQGKRLYHQNRTLLDSIAKQYGVPAPYIVALWGIETSYGNNTGGFSVIDSLATLAYDGRRSSYFRKELINALKILDAGHIDLAHMKGSWAGAMGQNQFMPSSFHAYAADGNHDGKRDIWTSLPDVFASTANYLSKSGWKEDERWGRAVHAPKSITKDMTGTEYKKPLAYWKKIGVTLPNGHAIPVVDGMKASLVMPDGLNGPAFLVYNNYRVILKWNRSSYFATSVGLLADQIAQ